MLISWNFPPFFQGDTHASLSKRVHVALVSASAKYYDDEYTAKRNKYGDKEGWFGDNWMVWALAVRQFQKKIKKKSKKFKIIFKILNLGSEI